MAKFEVQVIETATDEVLGRFAASSKRQAERLERGLNINLNHMEYHTQIEET